MLAIKFQNIGWPKIVAFYEKNLRFFLKGRNPFYLFYGIIALFFLSIFITMATKPKVFFFPDNQPNTINIFIKMPEGTDQLVTDSVTRLVENKVDKVFGYNNPLVESIVSNVGFGAGEGMFDRTTVSNKGKVTINFIESRYRHGANTSIFLDQLRNSVKDIPGVQISVEKNRMGPPTGKPVNIEVTGEKLDELIVTANKFQNYLDSLRIPGIEKLKSDFDNNKPEITIDIDRVRANREGLSIGQIGMELRTAIYGKEVSKYKEDEDEYPIQVRYSEQQRKNIDKIINARITYRDMNSGQIRQIPISSVAKLGYKDTYGGINRKNLKRVITISSEVLSGYTPNEVVAAINQSLESFNYPQRDYNNPHGRARRPGRNHDVPYESHDGCHRAHLLHPYHPVRISKQIADHPERSCVQHHRRPFRDLHFSYEHQRDHDRTWYSGTWWYRGKERYPDRRVL